MNAALVTLIVVVVSVLVYMWSSSEHFNMVPLVIEPSVKMVSADEMQLTVRWSSIKPKPYRIGVDVGGYKDLRNIALQPVDKDSITVVINRNTAPHSGLIGIRVYAVDDHDDVFAVASATVPNPFFKPHRNLPKFEYGEPHLDCSSDLTINA
jgi:hypothetical protein